MILDPLTIRRRLGRKQWGPPRQLSGEAWGFAHVDGEATVLASVGEFDGVVWTHASIARRNQMPSYEDLTHTHQAVFGDGWAYQVFAPPTGHVNLHGFALHLWGPADGSPVLPNFGYLGTI